MSRVTPPPAGRVQDAIRILRGEYDDHPEWTDLGSRQRAAEAVQHMLNLYWSENWPSVMERRPKHVPEDLWVKWGLENELIALRAALADAHERINELRQERDLARSRAIETDADIAAFVHSAAKETARLESDARRFREERFQFQQELRQERADNERLRRQMKERV